MYCYSMAFWTRLREIPNECLLDGDRLITRYGFKDTSAVRLSVIARSSTRSVDSDIILVLLNTFTINQPDVLRFRHKRQDIQPWFYTPVLICHSADKKCF